MFDTFQNHLARQCAVGREKFGPGERSKGVREHILDEFDEIDKAQNANERAEEWTDVAILALDGLLRAVREALRENASEAEGIQVDREGRVLGHSGEPTNDLVANVAVNMIRTKQGKNELRDFGNWREASEDEPMQHKAGIHD